LASPFGKHWSDKGRHTGRRRLALWLPSIHHLPEIVEDGGLVGYGARITAMYRQMARLLVKVLRGTAPADPPVEQPAAFELVFNLKTAAAIGLVVPPSLLLRADKVIEQRYGLLRCMSRLVARSGPAPSNALGRL
jgi:putative ABC transport system substrate-binding protein